MENIFKNARAIFDIMEQIPMEERAVTVEIATKLLHFADQKRECGQKDAYWEKMQIQTGALQQSGGVAGAQSKDIRRNN